MTSWLTITAGGDNKYLMGIISHLGCYFILFSVCSLGSPQSALVLSHPGQHVAVERVEVVVIRDIMSDDFSIDDVTLALLAGFVQSLEDKKNIE